MGNVPGRKLDSQCIRGKAFDEEMARNQQYNSNLLSQYHLLEQKNNAWNWHYFVARDNKTTASEVKTGGISLTTTTQFVTVRRGIDLMTSRGHEVNTYEL